MVDQSSGAEIIYLDLYKGLNLKPKDLISYNSPLMGFNGKIVIPKGLIRLPIQARLEVVKVNFIVVEMLIHPILLFWQNHGFML